MLYGHLVLTWPKYFLFMLITKMFHEAYFGIIKLHIYMSQFLFNQIISSPKGIILCKA